MATETFFETPAAAKEPKVKDFLNLTLIPQVNSTAKKKIVDAKGVKIPKGIALTDHPVLNAIRDQAIKYAEENQSKDGDPEQYEFILVGKVHIGKEVGDTVEITFS